MIAGHVYRGRLAPSPTGYLHLGHAQTFLIAQKRAQERNGTLLLRVEDLDRTRCKPEFIAAMLEDLRWCGLGWDEEAIFQSRRSYAAARDRLLEGGFIYPCVCSRKDVLTAARAPHEGDEEPFPLRVAPDGVQQPCDDAGQPILPRVEKVEDGEVGCKSFGVERLGGALSNQPASNEEKKVSRRHRGMLSAITSDASECRAYELAISCDQLGPVHQQA